MRRREDAGFTYIEVMITIAILLILAAVTIPVARTTIQRQRELELKAALREMRNAIDNYKKYVDAGQIQAEGIDNEGYPPDLDALVEGIPLQGTIDKKIKFLRRIPKDPMTATYEWGLRSLQDDPNSTSWGRQNVYDVYTTSEAKGLDGTPYSQW